MSGQGAPSEAVNYQQFYLRVSEPAQTYWLNDHGYLAHDIHEEDYVAVLRVAGGARIEVVMHDGNEREIANFTRAYFSELASSPSTGQSLALDVLSVALAP